MAEETRKGVDRFQKCTCGQTTNCIMSSEPCPLYDQTEKWEDEEDIYDAVAQYRKGHPEPIASKPERKGDGWAVLKSLSKDDSIDGVTIAFVEISLEKQDAYRDREVAQLNSKAAELHSLRQSIVESNLLHFAPKREISFHDKVVFAIGNIVDENTSLKEALIELLQVKEWKEKNGKDEHYLKAQPIAWENARKLIENSK